MKYRVTIKDGGISIHHIIEAENIDAACTMIEAQMRETEFLTAGNPDCEPRGEWTAITSDGYAECSLRGESQDAQSWARATIVEVKAS